MATRGEALLKKLGRLALGLLVVVFVVVSILTSINFGRLPGMPGSSGLPDVPSVDQTTLDKAAASTAGQQLKRQGFTAKSVIADDKLVSWLNEQEKHQNLGNPGPYVLFSATTQQASKPDPGIPPDVLVDANYGVVAALYQAYTDQRGAACYNAGSGRDTTYLQALASKWVILNVYLWKKSLDSNYEVAPNDVSLPAKLGTIHCYAFVP